MKTKWIPVEERLPGTVHTVIITIEIDGRKVVSFGWYSPKNKAWNLLDETYIRAWDPKGFTVLAWRDLPEEYKEGT